MPEPDAGGGTARHAVRHERGARHERGVRRDVRARREMNVSLST